MAARTSTPVMHVALLRGINVGKAKRVAMADLRALCEGLGYGNVKTLLNSGNVVFSAPRVDAKAAAKIRKEIASQIGVSCRVIVITGAELDRIVEENPIAEGEANPPRFLVTVFASESDRARIAALATEEWGAERMGVGSIAAYLWCPNGILESRIVAAIAKQLGDGATSRNWATMKKLQALMTGGAKKW
ncbi:MAG: DUF1697 domain-containing protein [Gemmatimonadota bacterium]|nr:DUF1697 domain-containing protein [Gemmatimonadota bacterium]